ncbi:hypothetical protein QBC46DRAFT_413812 [Diplogelasinospora grovesii]|uniref:Uncharacterized protein n=1 Tax=Diplogelasinospora grovesii TaxID=303347 RepID=A0AAN6MWE2_9PEZI|nr:hypothetical protein QBC46DRAFT_413812 [Diplogelasinospora grovesii]
MDIDKEFPLIDEVLYSSVEVVDLTEVESIPQQLTPEIQGYNQDRESIVHEVSTGRSQENVSYICALRDSEGLADDADIGQNAGRNDGQKSTWAHDASRPMHPSNAVRSPSGEVASDTTDSQIAGRDSPPRASYLEKLPPALKKPRASPTNSARSIRPAAQILCRPFFPVLETRRLPNRLLPNRLWERTGKEREGEKREAMNSGEYSQEDLWLSLSAPLVLPACGMQAIRYGDAAALSTLSLPPWNWTASWSSSGFDSQQSNPLPPP